MLLSRYLEERRAGRVPVRAASIAMRFTARATMTAALAAGIAYGSLLITRFEGFRQYGIIGLMGMILCWISSMVIFPAVLVQVERLRPIVTPKTRVRRPWVFGPLSRLIGRFPGPIFALFAGISILSVASFAKFDPTRILETNLTHLRNKESMERGSGTSASTWTRSSSASSRRSPCSRIRSRRPSASPRRCASGARSPAIAQLLTSVNTLQQFIPQDQPAKIEVIDEIRRELPPRLLRRLPAAEQSRVSSFLTPQVQRPLKQGELPHLVLDKFTEKDGSIGKLVLVEPPLDSSEWSGNKLNTFVRVLRETADKVASARVPVAGGLPVVSDMLEAISQDGPQATLFAFLPVVFLIVVLFRRPRVVAMVLFALVLGNLWLFGFILGTGFKINFLNFIAFPITFGIGIDYGVNVFHRYLHEPRGDILKVIRETGGAVGLCSLTTITGYFSLLIARNQAFVSFGWLAVVGEVTSLVAAVVALPALLMLLDRRRAHAEARPGGPPGG